MDETILTIIGMTWTLLNIYYVNSYLQEDNELQKTLMKINQPSELNDTIEIISRNNRNMLALSLAFCTLFLGLLLVKRTTI